MATDLQKDVYSINELDSLNSLLVDLNEFLVAHEDDDNLIITTAVLNVTDKDGRVWGALTKWDRNEDIKFEPDFRADLA